MGCATGKLDGKLDVIPPGTIVVVVAAGNPHCGRTGTVMKGGVRSTLVAFYDKIGTDELKKLPTSALMAAGGQQNQPESAKVTEADRQAWDDEQAEIARQDRKKVTEEVAHSGRARRSKTGNGRKLEIAVGDGKLVISAEKQQKRKKRLLQDSSRTHSEKVKQLGRRDEGPNSKYQLHKGRTKAFDASSIKTC